jgi:hypothetical protein
MKKIFFIGVLIFLLLVGPVAAVSIYYAGEQVIPVSTARENANSVLLSYGVQGKLGSSPSFWKDTTLVAAPITIYDQSGVIYSYLFDVQNKDGKNIGVINAAGNKLVAKPIFSIEKSARTFDPDIVLAKARDLATTAYPGAIINYVVLVMDQDKKIGVMVILEDANRLNRRLVYDVQTMKLRSDKVTNPGFLTEGMTTSIFTQMTSAQATRAIQSYNSQIRLDARFVPVVKQLAPEAYLSNRGNKSYLVTSATPGIKGNTITGYKSQTLSEQKISSINIPKGRTQVTSPVTTQTVSWSKYSVT